MAAVAIAVATAILGAATAGARDASTMVPLDHWGYPLLERLEARGTVHATADGIKPLSRAAMARLAQQADSVAAAGGAVTRLDRERIRRLLAELSPASADTAARGVDLARLSRARPPLRYATDRGALFGDLLARQQTDGRWGRGRHGRESIYRNRLGGVLRGDLGGAVGLRIAFEQTREQGSRDYILREDVFERRLEAVQLKGGVADYHAGAAYVTFALGPFVDVQIGKDQVSWGPAPDDNLGLSGNAPAFDMVRLRTRFGALELVSLHGALQPCPDRPDAPICGGEADSSASYIVNGMTRALDRQKWIAAHRVEAAVAPWLDLAFQEVVIYGDRGPQPAYLNPFTFYWAAQSQLGDRDNAMIAVDADARPWPGVRWFGAYAVDDLKKLEVFSDDFANKFSLQTGLLWTDPLGLRDVDARAEYVRIEPWIYTHKYPINAFRHFDAPLGHALGPNSDRWRVSVGHQWLADLATSLALSRTRHGDNVLLADGSVRNVGGDLHLAWRPGDERDSKHFLDGNVSRRTALTADLDWRPWPRLAVRAGFGVEWGENVRLPPRDGPATPLTVRTVYGDGRQPQLFLDVRYGVL